MGKTMSWILVALALVVGFGVGWALRRDKPRATLTKFRLVSALPEKMAKGVVKNVTNKMEGTVDVPLGKAEYTKEVDLSTRVDDPETVEITGAPARSYDVPPKTLHITLHVTTWDAEKPKTGFFVFVLDDGTSRSTPL